MDDEVVPGHPRGHSEADARARAAGVEVDAAGGEVHDRPVEAVVPDEEVRTARQQQNGLTAGVALADGVDHGVGGAGADEPAGRSPDPQRGVPGEGLTRNLEVGDGGRRRGAGGQVGHGSTLTDG